MNNNCVEAIAAAIRTCLAQSGRCWVLFSPVDHARYDAFTVVEGVEKSLHRYVEPGHVMVFNPESIDYAPIDWVRSSQ